MPAYISAISLLESPSAIIILLLSLLELEERQNESGLFLLGYLLFLIRLK